ncbi:hypothetical protein TruAng_003334 [Truncatella angustata]|nr:hypothetical protein TruAng_003334 [Truncatella angustata]
MSHGAAGGTHEDAMFPQDSNPPPWSRPASPALALSSFFPATREEGSSENTDSNIEADLLNLVLPITGKNTVFWDGAYEPSRTLCSLPTNESNSGLLTPTSRLLPTSLASVRTIAGSNQLHSSTITDLEAMAKLSKINTDLHSRVAAAETNEVDLDLNSLCYRSGPLYIDKSTLVEYVLAASQNFILVLHRLRASRPTRGVPCVSLSLDSQTDIPTEARDMLESLEPSWIRALRSPSDGSSLPQSGLFPSTPGASGSLSAPLALMITSIFVQLITLYELNLRHLMPRIERLSVEPILMPIPGLTFDGLLVAEPCTQGMQFSEVIVSLLERIERSLGIGMMPDGGEAGLLSVRQIQTLWSALQDNVDSTSGYGLTRVEHVKDRFRAVYTTLKQIVLK